MILYGDPIGSPLQAYPSTPPGMTDIWDRVGFFNTNVVAMISPSHFLFTNHAGGNIGDRFAIGGSEYSLAFTESFPSSVTGWTAGIFGGGAATVSWNAGGWADLVITSGGSNTQLRRTATISITPNRAIRVKFRAKASVASTLDLQVYGTGLIFTAAFSVTTAWQEFVLEGTTSQVTEAANFLFKAQSSWVGTLSVDDIEVRLGDSYTTTAKSSSGDVAVYTLDRPVPPIVRNNVAYPRHFRLSAWMGLPTPTEYPAVIVGRWQAKTSVLTGGSGAQGWFTAGFITQQLCWGTQGLPQTASASTTSVDFDGAEGNSEAAIHLGDSSAPIFLYQSGEWRLAALAYAVDSLIWGTSFAGRLNAVVHNRLGLYGTSASPNTQSTGQTNLHHSMAGYQAFITGVVPDAFDIYSKPYGRILDEIPVT